MNNTTAPTLRDSRPSWDYNPARQRELSQSQRRARLTIMKIFASVVVGHNTGTNPRDVLATMEEEEFDKHVTQRTISPSAALALLDLD